MRAVSAIAILAALVVAAGADDDPALAPAPPQGAAALAQDVALAQDAGVPAQDAAVLPDAASSPAVEGARVRFDFAGYEEGPVDAWLRRQGYDLERGAQSRREVDLAVEAGDLVVKALRRTRGFLVHDSGEVGSFGKVRVEWSVRKYPEGAGYEREVFNEALMLYVFFGREKQWSGGFGVPDSPYFVGLYLGRGDRQSVPFKGAYYHRGGRYMCVGSPEPNARVVTEFDLAAAFRRCFDREPVPPISGFALGVDTSGAGDGGRAEAVIRSIEFHD